MLWHGTMFPGRQRPAIKMHKSNPAELKDWAAEALFLVQMRGRDWEGEGDHYDERRWSPSMKGPERCCMTLSACPLGPSCSLGRILQRKFVVTRVDYVHLNNAWASSKAPVIVSGDRRRVVLELYWLNL